MKKPLQVGDKVRCRIGGGVFDGVITSQLSDAEVIVSITKFRTTSTLKPGLSIGEKIMVYPHECKRLVRKKKPEPKPRIEVECEWHDGAQYGPRLETKHLVQFVGKKTRTIIEVIE